MSQTTGESRKKELGQFFTTNYNYILKNLVIPDDIDMFIEPFTGNADLVKYINENHSGDYEKCTIECYDIDPKELDQDFPEIIEQDTITNPPDYFDKFVITNPPYLARNKSADKTIFDKYDQNDLYKCFIQTLIYDECRGGILIIPLNFWCSIRKSDVNLREEFLKKYRVNYMNIFEEQVFDDTGYAVCSFQFVNADTDPGYGTNIINTQDDSNTEKITCMVYPSKKTIEIQLNEENNFTIGGEIYKLSKSEYKIERATKNNKSSPGLTNILLKCIDDSAQSKIRMSIIDDDDRYIDETAKLSARSYATLVIEPPIDKKDQKKLVKMFNEYLEEMREQYNSLFLTNYRESNSIARKRISFNLAFDIFSHLMREHFE